jgi:glutamate mutase epsilon subunit
MEIIEKFLESKEYLVMKQNVEKKWFKLKGQYVNINEDDEFVNYSVNEIKEYFINKNIKIEKTNKVITYGKNGEKMFNDHQNIFQNHFLKFGDMMKKLKHTVKLNLDQI